MLTTRRQRLDRPSTCVDSGNWDLHAPSDNDPTTIDVIHEPESAGRKLEFVVQEMGREVNTIGSKASDVEIGRHVVEIKGVLEKIRELIQNVE